jgi:hypothetical protein
MEKEKDKNFSKIMDMWIEYLNNDEEIKKRIAKEGVSSSLGEGEKELIALKIKELPEQYVIGIKKGNFFFKKKKGESPRVYIETPLELFLKMAWYEDRVVWFLLNEEVRFTLIKGESWSNIVTLLEMFVALQELLDKEPKFKAA